jgi:hypothetical protein
MKKVTDQALLAELNAPISKKVTDPVLLRELNTPEKMGAADTSQWWLAGNTPKELAKVVGNFVVGEVKGVQDVKATLGQGAAALGDKIFGGNHAESVKQQNQIINQSYSENFGDSPAASYGRFAGNFTGTLPATAINPLGKLKVAGKVGEKTMKIIGNLLAQGGNGAAQGAAMAALTSSAHSEPVSEQIAVGGAIGAGVQAFLGGVVSPLVGLGARAAQPFTKAGIDKIASKLMRANADNPDALASLIQNTPEFIKGSQPTLAQAAHGTGDYGINSLEKGVKNIAPDAFKRQAAEQGVAQNAELARITPPETIKLLEGKREDATALLYEKAKKMPVDTDALKPVYKTLDSSIKDAGDTAAGTLLKELKRKIRINSGTPIPKTPIPKKPNSGGQLEELRNKPIANSNTPIPKTPLEELINKPIANSNTPIPKKPNSGGLLEELINKPIANSNTPIPKKPNSGDRLNDLKYRMLLEELKHKNPSEALKYKTLLDDLEYRLTSNSKTPNPEKRTSGGLIQLYKEKRDVLAKKAEQEGYLGSSVKGVVAPINKFFGKALAGYNPALAQADSVYAKLSQPINQKELLLEIQQNAQSPASNYLTDEPSLSLSRLATQLKNNATEIERILTPEQQAGLNALRSDLNRIASTDGASIKGVSAQSISNLGTKNLLNTVGKDKKITTAVMDTPIISKLGGWAYGNRDRVIQERLAELMANPVRRGTADLLEQVPKTEGLTPGQRAAIVNLLISRGSFNESPNQQGR